MLEMSGFHPAIRGVHVGGKNSTECECICAGLFLCDAPLFCLACFSIQIRADQFWPLDPGFCFEQAAFTIERNHPIQLTRIDANAVAWRIAATHRVPVSRTEIGQALSRRGNQQSRQVHLWCAVLEVREREAIELRMDVVNPNLFLAFREDVRRKRKKRRRAYEFTAGHHRGSFNCAS